MLKNRWRDLRAARKQALIFERIWHNFGTYRTTIDGRYDVENWSSEPDSFAAAVIRVPFEAFRPAFEPLAVVIGTYDFVRQTPDPFLHIMLQELGPVVREEPAGRLETTDERMDEFASAAVDTLAEVPNFMIELGRVNAFQDSIILEARDGGITAKIHARLHELAAIPSRSAYAYLPSVTIGQFDRVAPTGAIRTSLEPFRNEPLTLFEVNQIELVTIATDHPYPPLETRNIIPLGGRQPVSEPS